MSVNATNKKTNTLTINYYINGSNSMLAEPFIAELPIGHNYSINSPEILGFKLHDYAQQTVSGVLWSDTVIKVYYNYASDAVSYTVEYLIEDPIKNTFSLFDSESFMATYGENITVTPKVIPNYELRTTDLSIQIYGENNKKQLYYTKTDKKYIIFQTGGSYIPPILAKAGEDISAEVTAITNPSKMGYTFDGWNNIIPDIMPNDDLVVKANWISANSNYVVIHWFQNIDDDKYTMSGIYQKLSGKTDSIASGFTIYNDANPTFLGMQYHHKDENVTIRPDGKTIVNVYYNRIKCSITFKNLDGSTYKTITGRYGKSVEGDYPTRQDFINYYGNTFIGFKGRDGTWRNPPTYGSVPDSSDKYELVLTPQMGNSYVIEIKVFAQNIYDDNDSYLRSIHAVTNGPLTATIVGADGFTWIGGKYRTGNTDATKGAVVDFDNLPFTSPIPQVSPYNGTKAGGFIIFNQTEIYCKRLSYNVVYQSKGVDVKTESLRYQADVDLSYVPQNTDPDYRFVGWYTSPDLMDTVPPLKSSTMPVNGLRLFAKWERIPYTLSFDSNGGTLISPQYVIGGTSGNEPAIPTKAGNEFKGWFTATGERWVFDHPVNEDTILYAKWKTDKLVNYTVIHKMIDTGEVIKTETGSGYTGEFAFAQALSSFDTGYPEGRYLVPDFKIKNITIDFDDSKNIITFLYKDPNEKKYTVRYIDEKDNSLLVANKIVLATKKSIVTEFSIPIKGYQAKTKYVVSKLSVSSENVIDIYYIKENQLKPNIKPPLDEPETSKPPQTDDISRFTLLIGLSLVSSGGVAFRLMKKKGLDN